MMFWCMWCNWDWIWWECVFWICRKLCVYKGIFPREPKKKFKGNHHTYYHLKDVSFIRHDPILEELRAKTTYLKKVTKAKAKKNRELAEALLKRQPEIKLDRLVLERFVFWCWLDFLIFFIYSWCNFLVCVMNFCLWDCIGIRTLLMLSEIWMILSLWCICLLLCQPMTGLILKWSVSTIAESKNLWSIRLKCVWFICSG